MNKLVYISLVFCLGCTKQIGVNPDLALSDKALLDSCRQQHHYHRGSSALLPARGPHGEHTLRFNSVALGALDSAGVLAPGKFFPPGSLIIKDTYEGSSITIYSLMYKGSSGWLWSESRPNGEVIHSVGQNPATCTGCHSGTGNRDQVLSFN